MGLLDGQKIAFRSTTRRDNEQALAALSLGVLEVNRNHIDRTVVSPVP
jgi:hypothetical protein